MKRMALGLVCAIGLAAGAQAPKRDEWQESAEEMKLGPCPAAMRTTAGIDSTEDWRIHVDVGFRYCVPARWTTTRPQPRHPDMIIWKDGETSFLKAMVAGRISVSVNLMYPRDYPMGSRSNMWMGVLGGVKAETWEDSKGPGFGTYAVFRNEELLFTAYSREKAIARMQRAAIRSIRFTQTSGAGSP